MQSLVYLRAVPRSFSYLAIAGLTIASVAHAQDFGHDQDFDHGGQFTPGNLVVRCMPAMQTPCRPGKYYLPAAELVCAHRLPALSRTAPIPMYGIMLSLTIQALVSPRRSFSTR